MEITKQKTAYSYVRFSTTKQLKGDSERRQTEKARLYCKENNLILDESINMRDLGVSAFRGANKNTGALSKFLNLVKQGKIKKGSILIIEHFDRLSREDVLTAFTQFSNIINSGIAIATLSDNMLYSKETIKENWVQLIISIVYMAKANDESLLKSNRLKSVWKQKREKANNEIITKKCPAWLKYNEKDKTFEPIQEVVSVINQIFDFKINGLGSESITKRLNTDNSVWKPAKGWRKSYVNKILYNNRTLLGEYQPYHRDEATKKRVAIGDVIKDYYPAIVDEDKFNAVQRLIQNNRAQKGYNGGRTGKCYNIFSHIAICPKCGAPMYYINKGVGNNAFLQCSNSRRGKCDAKPIRYDIFSDLFFKDFEELDINELLDNNKKQENEIKQMFITINGKRYELSETKRKIDNLTEQIITTNDKEIRSLYEKKLSELLINKNTLLQELKDLETEKALMTNKNKQLLENVNNAKNVFELLNNAKTEAEQIEIRIKLKVIIQRIVKEIKIYPYDPNFPDVDNDIIQFAKNKCIQKIVIKFNGIKKIRLLQYQGYAEKFNN